MDASWSKNCRDHQNKCLETSTSGLSLGISTPPFTFVDLYMTFLWIFF